MIAELYKRLVEAYWHGRSFVFTSENNRSPSQQEEFVKIQKEMNELFFFIEQHRIYLSDSVCTLLDKFVGDVRGNVVAAGIFTRVQYPSVQTVQQSEEASSTLKLTLLLVLGLLVLPPASYAQLCMTESQPQVNSG